MPFLTESLVTNTRISSLLLSESLLLQAQLPCGSPKNPRLLFPGGWAFLDDFPAESCSSWFAPDRRYASFLQYFLPSQRSSEGPDEEGGIVEGDSAEPAEPTPPLLPQPLSQTEDASRPESREMAPDDPTFWQTQSPSPSAATPSCTLGEILQSSSESAMPPCPRRRATRRPKRDPKVALRRSRRSQGSAEKDVVTPSSPLVESSTESRSPPAKRTRRSRRQEEESLVSPPDAGIPEEDDPSPSPTGVPVEPRRSGRQSRAGPASPVVPSPNPSERSCSSSPPPVGLSRQTACLEEIPGDEEEESDLERGDVPPKRATTSPPSDSIYLPTPTTAPRVRLSTRPRLSAALPRPTYLEPEEEGSNLGRGCDFPPDFPVPAWRMRYYPHTGHVQARLQ